MLLRHIFFTAHAGQQAISSTPRHAAYALQKLFKEEHQYLQELGIIAPLGVDEMAEWCNSFVLVPKANGKVWLCLDPHDLTRHKLDQYIEVQC